HRSNNVALIALTPHLWDAIVHARRRQTAAKLSFIGSHTAGSLEIRAKRDWQRRRQDARRVADAGDSGGRQQGCRER
ncbi:MAG TPA: hypothetical protein VME22_25370, partial [Solirubrobacteraceae bacterium]|nr:hypothetical protein [Solirubrobacteraceae bacterium]